MRTPFDEPKISSTISSAEWLGILIVSMIPLLNLAAFGYWAFSSNTNPTKANYARAILIIYGLMLVLALILFIALDRSGKLATLIQ